ncbi:hypothetical protein [Halanaerobacter jeridensis]|uniref:Uncharacterized protein n=1 Tax=Halanaerobacter jeridensis TaxID=706427 RepID=A0A939BQF0_9FIRM|nr:hypothetical protein [Halanaerobacter jeridensis]MBM7558232.1 hypothetical protein [Halanaerobacter jeridensis]
MNKIKIISLILGSSVLSSIITSFISKIINDKNNSLKYITEERRNWRKNIRKIISKLVIENNKNKAKKLVSHLELNLNPYDTKDECIIDLAKKLLKARFEGKEDKEEEKDIENKLIKTSSYLLKHDWERAKQEARFKFNPFYILNTLILIWVGQIIFGYYFNIISIPDRIKTIFLATLVFSIILFFLYYIFRFIKLKIKSKLSPINSEVSKILNLSYRKELEE